MKKYLLILLACIPGLVSDAYGQIVALTVPESDKVTLGNVQVSKDSDNIYVDYDILFGSRILSCLVGLEVSLNAGKSFEPVTDGLSGDIHRVESSGHKRIALPLNIYARKIADKSIVFNVFVSDVESAPFDCSGVLNLSTGGTANCYIVSRGGVYSILPVKGNSSVSVGSVAYAEVLWESFGTSESPKIGDLVEAALYSNGQIYFKVPAAFREGNAVIAAKDASGTILWSWHIWLTDQPKEQVYYNNAGTMMDRNLGATSSIPGDVGALGLLYQWGRKDPFLGLSSISSSVEAKSTAIWPSAVKTSSRKGTVDYATANPMTFISGTKSSEYDWYYSSRNNDLWTSSKTIYDPCPAGWRVPDGGEYGVWSNACGSSSSFDYQYDGTDEGMNFSGKFGSASVIWYPASGYRYSHVGSLSYVGYGGFYWSVTSESNYAYGLHFNNNGRVNPSDDNGRANGQVVRCLQE